MLVATRTAAILKNRSKTSIGSASSKENVNGNVIRKTPLKDLCKTQRTIRLSSSHQQSPVKFNPIGENRKTQITSHNIHPKS
jgi:hypothetical protein